MTQLKALFSPIKIGKLELKNRLVMAPMALHYANDKGMLSDRQITYYAARARGGVGLIISESNYVTPDGRGGVKRLGLYEDQMIPDHQRLTNAIHEAGSMIFAQLHHGGATISPAAIGQIPVAPSATPLMTKGEPFIGIIPRRLSKEEIKEIIIAFGEAGRRAKEANFDGVQVLAGHGYLINEFLSPHNNRRNDSYGGSKENRIRILVEIVAAIRERVGSDYPISIRLTGREFIPDGYGLDFTCWLVEQLEESVDEFSIAGGTYDERDWMVSPMRVPEGYQINQAVKVKEATCVPVSIVGRITDPVMADQVIEQGQADLVYMGRALIADPELPNKAKEGKLEEIRPCIGCNRGCIDRLFKGLDVRCTVNPDVGQETEAMIYPAGMPKKVLVVGGGPAGMEAARSTALRGHQVTLIEQSAELGGKLGVASKPPFRQSIDKFRSYQEIQLDKVGVEVKLKTEATPRLIEELAPDVVVIATGAKSIQPDITGVGLECVATAEDVLNGLSKPGHKVVIMGAGIIGLETAEYLAETGRQVTVIEITGNIAGDEEAISKKMLLLRLNDLGVRIYVNCKITNITSQGVSIIRLSREEVLPADTVVLAVGYRPNRDLFTKLNVDNREVYLIGDSKEARNIMEAVNDGALIGRQI